MSSLFFARVEPINPRRRLASSPRAGLGTGHLTEQFTGGSEFRKSGTFDLQVTRTPIPPKHSPRFVNDRARSFDSDKGGTIATGFDPAGHWFHRTPCNRLRSTPGYRLVRRDISGTRVACSRNGCTGNLSVLCHQAIQVTLKTAPEPLSRDHAHASGFPLLILKAV